MRYLMAVGAILLIVATLWDIICTTLLLSRGGPLSVPLCNRLWRLCLIIHYRLPSRRFLCFSGVAILLFTISLWILLYWLGWTLIFSASSQSVLSSSGEVPATFAERAYYVGFTLITLGIGDFKAGTVFWEFMTIILSISGFFVVTLVITYLLPVVSATVERREFAIYLHSLNLTDGALINSFDKSSSSAALIENISSLNMQICRLSELHLAYPVLHFLQSEDSKSSMALALAELDETLTSILTGGEKYRQIREKIMPLRNSMTIYLNTLADLHMLKIAENPPQRLNDGNKEAAGEEEFCDADNSLNKRRCLLQSLVAFSGWKWEDIKKRRKEQNLRFCD